MPKILVISNRIYRLLLLAYPTSFRREYGPDMAQVFRDACRAELAQDNKPGLVRLWFKTLLDWVKTAFEQNIREAFHMSGQKWLIRLGALAALAGGLLGLYLVTQGPNSYGNYDWDGWLAPVASLLLALGIGGAGIAYQKQLKMLGWFGLSVMITGLLLMGLGYAVESLWGFIFMGPLIIVPIGAIMLGISNYPNSSLPTWWRFFPLVVTAITLSGFGIELLEEFIGNSTPDRGVQLAQALLSLTWIGLGVGLWLNQQSAPDEPRLAA